MVSKDDGFRVFGGVLGLKDAFVDVTVSAVDYDGNVYVTDSNSNEYEFAEGELKQLREEELCVYEGDVPVPTHAIWDDMESVASTRKNNDFNNVIDELLEDAVRKLFRAVIEYGK